MLIRRLFWLILIASLLLIGAVAFGVAPWLKGEFGYFWPYRIPELSQIWPFLLGVAIYTTLIISLERRINWRRGETGQTGYLILFACASICLQLAILSYNTFDPLSELISRVTERGSGGYFNAVTPIDDWRIFLKTFPELMPNFEAHPQRHPPGLPMLFLGWRLLLERFPEMANSLARIIRLEHCTNADLMYLSDARLASAWVGMILPLLFGASLVWPVYALGVQFVGKDVGWRAAAWVPLLPTITLFTPKWNQLYPFLCVVALLFLWRGLKAGQILWLGLTGLVMSVCTFFSFTNLIFLAPLGLLFLSHHGNQIRVTGKLDLRNMVIQAMSVGIGFVSVWLAYWAYSGVTPFDIWKVASLLHFGIDLPYAPWLWLNIQDFFTYGGWILAGLALIGLVNAAISLRAGNPLKNEGLLIGVFWMSLMLLDVSGMSEGEVSRVWSSYLPLMTLAAVIGLDKIGPLKAKYALSTVILALNIAVLGSFIELPGLGNYVPSSLPPFDYATDNVVPIDADFEGLARLDGYTIDQVVSDEGQQSITVTLNWEPLARFDEVYHVFVHLYSADNQRVAQSDSIPAQFTYPTTCWQPGQHIGDPHILTLPADALPNPYHLQVGMFLLDTGQRLSVTRDGFSAQDFVQINGISLNE